VYNNCIIYNKVQFGLTKFSVQISTYFSWNQHTLKSCILLSLRVFIVLL